MSLISFILPSKSQHSLVLLGPLSSTTLCLMTSHHLKKDPKNYFHQRRLLRSYRIHARWKKSQEDQRELNLIRGMKDKMKIYLPLYLKRNFLQIRWSQLSLSLYLLNTVWVLLWLRCSGNSCKLYTFGWCCLWGDWAFSYWSKPFFPRFFCPSS